MGFFVFVFVWKRLEVLKNKSSVQVYGKPKYTFCTLGIPWIYFVSQCKKLKEKHFGLRMSPRMEQEESDVSQSGNPSPSDMI